jgi:hypothetical protein
MAPENAPSRKRKQREAAQKAIDTKGPEELSRAGRMAAWTRKHGKDDTQNPHSKQNSRPRR